MSKQTNLAAMNNAYTLCLDAFGNGATGNTERSLRYLAEAITVLRLGLEVAQAQGVKAEAATGQAFAEHIAALRAKGGVGADSDWPKYEVDPEAAEKWLTQRWAQGVLPTEPG